MADYELIGLNEAAPDLRAPTSADRGIIAGGVRVVGLAELDGGADINGSRITTVTDTNPLRQAVRVAMTAAASGSTGIQVLNNANVNMGTNDFTLHWEGALPDWTPPGVVFLINKRSGLFPSTAIGYQLFFSSGVLTFQLMNGAAGLSISRAFTYPFAGLADFSHNVIDVVIDRMSSIQLFVNGLLVETVDTTATDNGATVTDSTNLAISGDYASRTASDTTNAIIYNRALSAAEVLSLCVNGPALADIGASQVAVFTSDFSAGTNSFAAVNGTVAGNIDGIGGLDDWLRLTLNTTNAGHATQRTFSTLSSTRYRVTFTYFIPSSNSNANNIRLQDDNGIILSSTIFSSLDAATTVSVDITTGTTATWGFYALDDGAAVFQDAGGDDVIYIRNVIITRIGITGQWNAEDAQSSTGQIFDSSGNKNHALLPAAGATIIGRPTAQPQQVRWTNTWAGTNELQYIGGVNQAILPANAYIDSIVGTVSGATPHDIIVGDGTDADRYVTITTGLATGTTTFTLANRTTDGTNLKLTVDPDTNCTMSIAWVISYRILE